jgi:hypothetical protein
MLTTPPGGQKLLLVGVFISKIHPNIKGEPIPAPSKLPLRSGSQGGPNRGAAAPLKRRHNQPETLRVLWSNFQSLLHKATELHLHRLV